MSNAVTLGLRLPAVVHSPAHSLEAYIKYVHSIPMLSEAEEIELATQLQENQDLEAAQRLVLSHLRFVVSVARGFSGYGLAISDLIQEGNIGLMKAVKRFNPSHGVRLVSFAVHWIKSEMHEYIIRNWRIVKVATTKAQRKLFFNLRNSKKRLGWFTHDEVESVAKDLGVKPETVREMEMRMSAHDVAFDKTDEDDEGSENLSFSPQQYLAAPNQNPEDLLGVIDSESLQLRQLRNALNELDDRSRAIIESRWLAEEKSTLHDLAARYNISAERVRQLETQAMKLIKGQLALS
jgi:RNA polymerase sigma-32 factor